MYSRKYDINSHTLEIGSVFLTGLISAISNNSKILNEIGVSEEYELAASVAFGIPNMEPIEKNLSENRFSIEYNE